MDPKFLLASYFFGKTKMWEEEVELELHGLARRAIVDIVESLEGRCETQKTRNLEQPAKIGGETPLE
jgi:hypothetical protein